MGMTLAGSSALVTGASSGIGAALADQLADRGCRLLLVGRDERRLSRTAERTGGRAVVADLTGASDLARVASTAREVDLLVNNAGGGWAGELVDMPAEDLPRLVESNLVAAAELTRSALPPMRRRGRGHLVFVSSVAALGVAEEAVYSATKAGLRAFAASVRHEAEPSGLGVTTVLPGAVRTSFFDGRGRAYDRRFPRQVPPERVARAIVRSVERGGGETFVPAWLAVAARVQGAAPELFHRLSRRFG